MQGIQSSPTSFTQAFTSKFRTDTLSLQLKIVQAMQSADKVSAASDNESILECEKELLVTTLMQNPSLILLLQLKILLFLLIMMTMGFTNFNPNVIKRSVSKIYV